MPSATPCNTSLPKHEPIGDVAVHASEAVKAPSLLDERLFASTRADGPREGILVDVSEVSQEAGAPLTGNRIVGVRIACITFPIWCPSMLKAALFGRFCCRVPDVQLGYSPTGREEYGVNARGCGRDRWPVLHFRKQILRVRGERRRVNCLLCGLTHRTASSE